MALPGGNFVWPVRLLTLFLMFDLLSIHVFGEAPEFTVLRAGLNQVRAHRLYI